MAKTFLSPIIIQPGGNFSVLYDNDAFSDRLSVLFGITIIIEYISNNVDIISCPFHDNIPLCKLFAKYNISEKCLSNPFLIKPFENGGCLFYNSCLILGLLPPEEFNRLIEMEDKNGL